MVFNLLYTKVIYSTYVNTNVNKKNVAAYMCIFKSILSYRYREVESFSVTFSFSPLRQFLSSSAKEYVVCASNKLRRLTDILFFLLFLIAQCVT